MNIKKYIAIMVIALFCAAAAAVPAYCQDDNTRNVLKQGLLGAGTGAIAAGASGGNAGQGALIGAGTNVIGGALLDAISGPSSSSSSSSRSAPQDEYYDDQRGEYYYEEPAPQQSGTSQILKQGLLGAGTGAIASGMSGGNAGKGALIGAGTNIIGGALLDAISQPAQPKRVYRRAPQPAPQQYQQPYQQQYQPQYQQPQQQVVQPQNIQVQEETVGSGDGRKKVIKKYDSNGKLVSEEEIYY